MDATSTSLVPLSPSQRLPVVLGAELDPRQADPDLWAVLLLLWRRFCKLATLFFLLLALCQRLRRQLVELRLQANYWKAQHQRAVQREADCKEQVQLLQGELREWKRRFFGRKSETAAASTPAADTNANRDNPKKRKRGQQPGSTGHGRRQHDHLTTTQEDCKLPSDQQRCPCCGEPLEEIPGTADGDILEMDVRAHRRRYHRCRYPMFDIEPLFFSAPRRWTTEIPWFARGRHGGGAKTVVTTLCNS